MSEFATKLRTHTCGELRASDVGAKPPRRPPALDAMAVVIPRGAPVDEGTITLCGHVDRKLDDTTLLLRDRYGKTLVKVDPGALPYVADRFGKAGPEDVVTISGDAALRSEREKDEASPTGEVYLSAKKIEILSLANPVPEGVMTAARVPVKDRLTYRQVYLRRPEMQARLEMRSKAASAAREFFLANQFLEVDTPQLFLFDPVAINSDMVPVSVGRAYSLAGGPLVGDTYIRPGGFDRFFQLLQITTAERDHTPLHAQEFTGLDMNMAYADMPDFMGMVDALLAHLWKTCLGKELKTPIARMTWHEAMTKYGAEKPDLRFGMELADLGDAAGAGQVARGFRAPGAAKLSTAELDEAAGAGCLWARVGDDGKLEGGAAALLAKKPGALGPAPGDVLVVASAAKSNAASRAAGEARRRFGAKLGLAKPGEHAFCWVYNHPCFDDDGKPAAIVFAKLARKEDMEILLERNDDRKQTQAKQFDLILDGVELASGYVGMHHLTEQRQFWERIHQLDLSDMSRMRAPIEAHRFGVPPWAGMNIGFDRLLARMCEVDAIDEVMTFPKTQDCKMPFLGAPGPIPAEGARFIVETDQGNTPAVVEEERVEA
ncbi:MAG TPA: amino acid--tRNA ligase-related protein [Planctomycetota bacterium]|nr:amino acid--tRNA ligase-related protein [Planctomycetota bacterium]